MSTYWDPKAARMVAGAEAQARRVEAGARREEMRLQAERARLELDIQRGEQARLDREAEDRRKAERAQARRRRRAARGKALVASVAAAGRGVRRWAPSLGGWLVAAVAMGAPIVIAWRGQLEFAEKVMHLEGLSPALPIALEGATWFVVGLTNLAISRGLPIGQYRLWTWALAGVAAGMNFWHAAASGRPDGVQTGVVLALASLLGVGLWELMARLRQHTVSGRSAEQIRRALWRWVRYPRLSWSAASIRIARDCGIEAAWQAAWIDRYAMGPHSSRRQRALGRAIVRRQAKAERRAARKGELGMVGGLVLGRPIPVVPTMDPHAAPVPGASIDTAVRVDARPVDRSSIGAPSIQGRSTRRRAVEAQAVDRPAPASTDRRRPRSIEAPAGQGTSAPRRSIDEHRRRLRELIEAGQLDALAKAEHIRKTLRCAPSVAAKLRDELREVAA
ncbi:hypothetical protein GCM10022226_21940 [Sphaerisporangium flaviroseum]|uniref:DUF2637 domain-containing protein n=1 Tax=Sphaerisporangium flaviroseum TaxID=509199 RepID=A0ABP7HQE7_9ACTN